MDQETFDRLSRSVMMVVSEFNCFLGMKPGIRDIRQQMKTAYNVPGYMGDKELSSFILAVLLKAKDIGFIEQSFDTYYIPRAYPGDCPPPSQPLAPPTSTTWSRRILDKRRRLASSVRINDVTKRPSLVAKRTPQLGLKLHAKRVKLAKKFSSEKQKSISYSRLVKDKI